MVGWATDSIHTAAAMPIDTTISFSGLFRRKVDESVVGPKRILASRSTRLSCVTTVPLRMALPSRRRTRINVVQHSWRNVAQQRTTI